MKAAYRARFGACQVSDQTRQTDRLLLNLQVELGMQGLGGLCRAELAGADHLLPRPGETVEVALNAGDGWHTVFTGRIFASRCSASTQHIEAVDALAQLRGASLSATYAEVGLDFVMHDLIKKTGAQVGLMCAAPKVSLCSLSPQPDALAHLLRLAQVCGADVYTRGDGKVCVATPGQGATQHAVRFGQDILALDLAQHALTHDSVEVWGEGTGDAADKAHWLAVELAAVCGKAAIDERGQVNTGKLGQRPLRVRDGLLRSAAAVQACAKARATWLASRRCAGAMELQGMPQVMPGDWVKPERLPSDHSASSLLNANAGHMRVRQVRHLLDRQRGFRTQLDF
jgi:hypothetical protein